MKMTVSAQRCKGCGLCIVVCPKKIVAIQTERRNSKGFFTAVCTNENACIACGLCAQMCPDCAIEVDGNRE